MTLSFLKYGIAAKLSWRTLIFKNRSIHSSSFSDYEMTRVRLVILLTFPSFDINIEVRVFFPLFSFSRSFLFDSLELILSAFLPSNFDLISMASIIALMSSISHRAHSFIILNGLLTSFGKLSRISFISGFIGC